MNFAVIYSKVPAWIRTIAETVVGENALDLVEEAWNLFPYCKTGECKLDERIMDKIIEVKITFM